MIQEMHNFSHLIVNIQPWKLELLNVLQLEPHRGVAHALYSLGRDTLRAHCSPSLAKFQLSCPPLKMP